jgi:hypothetical protein
MDGLFGDGVKAVPAQNIMEVSPALPFQNRDQEIAKIARACLRNLQTSKMLASDASTWKYTLLTLAQMWGSGKSWLGNHFLHQFRSPRFADLRKQLEDEFGEGAVAELLNAKYVLIDFRRFQGKLDKSTLDEFVLRCLVSSLLQFFPEDGEYWSKQPIKQWDCADIMNEFSNRHKTKFFIHFDEVDAILETQPAVDSEGLPAAERFYGFWKRIDPILGTGNFLYCSGRSAILYALGKGLYTSRNLISLGTLKLV